MNVICTPFYFGECQIAYWIWRTIPGCLIAVGTCGNILNLFILSRKSLRKFSTSIYLLFLAGSDLVMLWSSAFRETLYAISGTNFAGHNEFLCRTTYFLNFVSSSYSIWLLVLLTIERALMTRAPVFTWQKFTPRLAKNACIVLLIFITVFNGHLILGFTLHNVESFNNTFGLNNSSMRILEEFPCYYSSYGYRAFYEKYWNAIVLLLYNVVPMILIITGNFNIAVTIILQQKKHTKVFPVISDHNPSDVSKASQTNTQQTHAHAPEHLRDACQMNAKERFPDGEKTRKARTTQSAQARYNRSATRLLFGVCAFFVATVLPYCVYHVIKNQLSEVSYREVAFLQLIQSIIYCLLYCNFSFNFFMYFMCGTLFKKEWKRISGAAKSKLPFLSQRVGTSRR